MRRRGCLVQNERQGIYHTKEKSMTEALKTFSKDLADLVAGTADSVLTVHARRRLPASGIAWAEDLVITAHHGVESDADITIATAAGEQVAAQLVGRDPRNDLALLRVEGALQPANWAAADSLRVGDLAVAVARPIRIRASAGIVSGIVQARATRQRRRKMRMALQKSGKGKRPHRRTDKWRRRMRQWGGFALAEGLLQLDLVMYPGFSGGALLGADGGVHGLLTSGFGGGIGMAVPLSTLRSLVAALLSDGEIRSGYLGVGAQAAQLPDAIINTLEQETGLLVVSLEAGSPAAAAGLLVGDILVALGDEAIADIDELQLALTRMKVGATVAIAFLRGGELREGSITIGAR
ncbi:MAG: serine protease [Chloroflexi bacterium]|nr:serine protease [Chloroflexota bacterium]MXX50727.1 serine protease [Chloroflexota bacterium]MXX84683.1 serine protease [Chloroflexota bacterium]MYC54921.1 serine protease [Chloroflexota bacterium]MYE78653.1 serine protease [Chloroflexota bacterium]